MAGQTALAAVVAQDWPEVSPELGLPSGAAAEACWGTQCWLGVTAEAVTDQVLEAL